MKKILIVEDEFIIGFGIQHILEKNNYQVCGIISKGEEAILKAIELQPDLILMDINLAGEIDGIEAADEIKKNYIIPVIFLTSYVDSLTVNRAKKSNPFAYLVKPVDSKELLITIEMALYKFEMQNLLKDKENTFKSILRNLSDAVVATFNDYRINFHNNVAEKLFKEIPALQFRSIFELNILDNDGNKIKSIDDYILEQNNIIHYKDKILECTASKIINDKYEASGFVFVFRDISDKYKLKQENENYINDLNKAIQEIKRLSGLLSICSYCQKIKDENGVWQKNEDFSNFRSDLQKSHGICPDCLKKMFPDKADKILNDIRLDSKNE